MQQTTAYWQGLVKMSLTKFFLLRAVAEGPLHGYDLIRRARRLSEGTCDPTAAAVYPVLREWEAAGLVDGAWEAEGARRRRVYRITESGRAACEVALEVWEPAARALLRAGLPRDDKLEDHLL